MKINKVECFNKTELIKKIKKVTMLKDPDSFVYENTFVSLESINTNCLIPPQNYVLNYELENKLELKYELKKHNVNLFNLDGYIEFYLEGEDIKRTLLPPIVEESIEDDGIIIPIICDGMHRCYLSRVERKKIQVVYIRGISKEYPYYAYPVLNGWDKVERIDKINGGYIKKWHRIKDNKKLYRNFDSVFSNCSKPRGVGK